MKILNKIYVLVLLFFLSQTLLYAETPHFLDFKLILNKSIAGKKAQDYLKNKLDTGFKNIQKKEKNMREEEKKIIQQKKLISGEEFKKQVTELRKKVSTLQKEKTNLLESVAKQKQAARSELLSKLNPIISNYMKEKKIRVIIDKKSLILADEKLDITKDILEELNKQLKSLKIN
jgi:Skp family chaperone for outer membrane proteins